MQPFKIVFRKTIKLEKKDFDFISRLDGNAEYKESILAVFKEVRAEFYKKTPSQVLSSPINPKDLYPTCANLLRPILQKNGIGINIPCESVLMSPVLDINITYNNGMGDESWSVFAILVSKEYLCLNTPKEDEFVCQDLETDEIHFFTAAPDVSRIKKDFV